MKNITLALALGLLITTFSPLTAERMQSPLNPIYEDRYTLEPWDLDWTELLAGWWNHTGENDNLI